MQTACVRQQWQHVLSAVAPTCTAAVARAARTGAARSQRSETRTSTDSGSPRWRCSPAAWWGRSGRPRRPTACRDTRRRDSSARRATGPSLCPVTEEITPSKQTPPPLWCWHSVLFINKQSGLGEKKEKKKPMPDSPHHTCQRAAAETGDLEDWAPWCSRWELSVWQGEKKNIARHLWMKTWQPTGNSRTQTTV